MGIVAIAFNYLIFDDYEIPDAQIIRTIGAAIVLTGEFSRIDVGLQLQSEGKIPRLFISGFNPGAGLTDAFVEQFSKRNPSIRDLGSLMACCIEYGVEAETTFQNALEVKCWLAQKGIEGPILLITSRNHMARALADFRGALPLRKIFPYPVFDAPPLVGESRAREYARYLVSLGLSPLPVGIDPRDAGPFFIGCPPVDRAESADKTMRPANPPMAINHKQTQ